MGKSIFISSVLVILIGDFDGIIDYLTVACVNGPNWITFPFNEPNHQENPIRPT
jgi:hypothetical protein